MPLFFRNFVERAAMALLAGWCVVAQAFDPVADMALLYTAQVDRTLRVPVDEARHYGRLAEDVFAKARVTLVGSEYLILVDRDPNVQALFLFFRAADGESQLVGASPVSTGRPGRFDHFETPLGVFEHTTANPDYRAEGTRNSQGIRGYGVKGMRIYDFGWQQVPKGWGDGAVSEMRLQMHATDPDLLERRLGSTQSKGCIRIPASLNRLIDRYGVLDADYERAQREGSKLWVFDPQRDPVPFPGRYLIVVDTEREDRPQWSPGTHIPHRKRAAPAAK